MVCPVTLGDCCTNVVRRSLFKCSSYSLIEWQFTQIVVLAKWWAGIYNAAPTLAECWLNEQWNNFLFVNADVLHLTAIKSYLGVLSSFKNPKIREKLGLARLQISIGGLANIARYQNFYRPAVDLPPISRVSRDLTYSPLQVASGTCSSPCPPPSPGWRKALSTGSTPTLPYGLVEAFAEEACEVLEGGRLRALCRPTRPLPYGLQYHQAQRCQMGCTINHNLP